MAWAFSGSAPMARSIGVPSAFADFMPKLRDSSLLTAASRSARSLSVIVGGIEADILASFYSWVAPHGSSGPRYREQCILNETGIEGEDSLKTGYLALGIVVACSIAPMGVRADDQFINWRTDYRAALQEAKQAQKPVF